MRQNQKRRAFPDRPLKRQAHPVVALREPMLRYQLLVEVLRRIIPVTGIKQFQNLRNGIDRYPVVCQTTKAAIVETRCPFRIKAIFPAAKRAYRNTQYRARTLF
jgi:hypothetical protein